MSPDVSPPHGLSWQRPPSSTVLQLTVAAPQADAMLAVGRLYENGEVPGGTPLLPMAL